MSLRGVMRTVTGSFAVIVAAAAAGAIAVGGYLIPVQRPDAAQSVAQPMQGRVSSVCTTGTLTGRNTDSSESTVYGAATRADDGASGSLTGRLLGDGDTGNPKLSIDKQGQSKIIKSPPRSVVLVADGVLAGASAGMVYGSANSGEDRGLSLGPCAVPAVDQWFTGLGATSGLRSQLVLTNPDDRQAQVDLEFFGPRGPLSVPGATGLIIPADSSRTLSLEDLLGGAKGDIAVQVKASVGRVAAIARDLQSGGRFNTPTGVDWHAASAAPATTQIIPAIPGGPGHRQLTIFNPNERRADVKIEILGPDGPFAPADAATLSISPHASAGVDVANGLAEAIGTVRVNSNQPVVSSVRTELPADKGAPDIAVNSAQPPINGLAMAPAAVIDGSETDFAVSNGADKISKADVTLYNSDGVSIYHEKIPVPPGGTIERRVSQAGPAYLVVRTPDGSKLYGGITLRQQGGKVAGIAAAALMTPGLAGQGRTPVENAQVGQ